jgi:hypothetical protein
LNKGVHATLIHDSVRSILTESRMLMTNALSTGLADSPARINVRWPGVLSVAMVAVLAVLPAYAAAGPATQPGAPVLILAQAASDAEQPAGEPDTATPDQPAGDEAAAGGKDAPQPSPADSPAVAEEPAGEAAQTPAGESATETVSQPPPIEGLPGYPPILRSDADMPEPVRKTWAALRDAARLGDIEALQPLIEAQPLPPTFAFDEIDQPILYLKSLSGDPEGREILAILLEVLESGFVLADPDTAEAMYLWPYFARYPLEELTPEQMVEMFKLLTAGDYQDMLSYGAYIFFRVGISPDGVWHFFVAGD